MSQGWAVEKCGFAIGVGDSGGPAYNSVMEISLAPELEAKLARIASEAGKAANQVVQELVTDYLDHDEWFKREVQKGLASLDDGKFVSHEDVGRQIERILRP
jgi:predicted transcriptional regulator